MNSWVSTTVSINRALCKGCRCLELDCWDGPNLEPVIYHGYTFTSKIFLCDALRAIRDYAFKVGALPKGSSGEEMHGSDDSPDLLT